MVTEETTKVDETIGKVPGRKRKKGCVVLSVLILLTVLVWFLPSIISKTSLRDSVLNSIAGTPDYQLSSGRASLGWFAPLVIEDLKIANSDGSSTITIQKLTSDKSWLSLWFSSPQLGAFTITRPQVDIAIGEIDDEEQHSSVSIPTFTAIVQNAHVLIRKHRDEQPEIDIDEVGFTAHLGSTNSVALLKLDPIRVFDRMALTAELCNQGLQLVAPVLENEIDVQGSVSLEITSVQIPLGNQRERFSKLTELKGVLEVHQLSAGIRNEMTKRLASLFADLFDLGELPDEFTITENARVSFEVGEDGVFHTGLAIVLPDIAPDFSVRTSGLVSMDEQIDLQFAAKLPKSFLGDTALAQKVARTAVEIRVSGSTTAPVLGLPSDPKWVTDLSQDLVSTSLNEEEQKLADDLIQLIAELVQDSEVERAKIPQPLLERIQSIPQAAKR